MVRFEDSAAAIPFVFLIAEWAMFSRRRPMTRVWTSAVATLISLPIGLWLVQSISFPPNYFAHEHDAGIGLVFLPLVAGWVLCAFVWATFAVITAVRSYWLKTSN